MNSDIKHVVVLMLENRSFDHMLGYMDYEAFENYRLTGEEFNLDPEGTPVEVSMDAPTTLRADPGHYLGNVMRQVYEHEPPPRKFPPPPKATNGGFVLDYERVARPRAGSGYGKHIMRCFNPARETRVLANLARDFAVCTQWFCSVPAATWPNRNFAHAATSRGWVSNPHWSQMRGLFPDTTIFEQLDRARGSWKVFSHGYTYQAMGFQYVVKNRRNVQWISEFYKAVEGDRLPQYSFIEPYHIWRCNSQHPYYVGANTNAFARGETLIGQVYNSLRKKPDVFEKTLLLITYDEHGGFFDRAQPPTTVAPDDYRREPEFFDFGSLGVRVPAVLVSPRIKAGTVDTTRYDHSSIPKTVRDLFTTGLGSLTHRDEQANPFHRIANLDAPRKDLPEIVTPVIDELEDIELSAERLSDFDDFQTSLLELALAVGGALEAERRGESLDESLMIATDQPASPLTKFSNDRDLVARLDELAPLLLGSAQ